MGLFDGSLINWGTDVDFDADPFYPEYPTLPSADPQQVLIPDWEDYFTYAPTGMPVTQDALFDSIWVDPDTGAFVNPDGTPLHIDDLGPVQTPTIPHVDDLGPVQTPADPIFQHVDDLGPAQTPASPVTAWLNGLVQAAGSLGRFLETPIGRMAATGLLGAAGLAVARGVTGGGSGSGSTVQVPPPTQNPVYTAAQSALLGALTGPVPAGQPATGAQTLASLLGNNLAGQNALAMLLRNQAEREVQADQATAPAMAAIRALALSEIPGLLDPSANAVGSLATGASLSTALQRLMAGDLPAGQSVTGTVQDPLQADFDQRLRAALQQGAVVDPFQAEYDAQLRRALEGEVSNPALARRQAEQQRRLEQDMTQRYGVDWRNSTPGARNLQLLQESHTAELEGDRRSALSTLAPEQRARYQHGLEANIRELSVLGPQQFQRYQYGQELPFRQVSTLLPAELSRAQFAEDMRKTGLNERIDLQTLGRTPSSTLYAGLAGTLPIQPLLGLSATDQSNASADQFMRTLAQEEARRQQQSDRELAQAIMRIFGDMAGSLPRTGTA
jgi:hypothetical protein